MKKRNGQTLVESCKETEKRLKLYEIDESIGMNVFRMSPGANVPCGARERCSVEQAFLNQEGSEGGAMR